MTLSIRTILFPAMFLLAAVARAGDDGLFIYHGLDQDRSSDSVAEALFVEKCSMCHRQAGMGTFLLGRRVGPAVAMLEDRKDLTVDYVKVVARYGLGNMPRIPRGEVSDEELDVIANYLVKSKR